MAWECVDNPKAVQIQAHTRSGATPCLWARCWTAQLVIAGLLLHACWCSVLSAHENWLCWAPKIAGPEPGSPDGIPRIIHQMYKDKQLPPEWARVPVAWAAHHGGIAGQGGYTYMLWTDDELRLLIQTEYSWLLELYDDYPHATQRWDASRCASTCL